MSNEVWVRVDDPAGKSAEELASLRQLTLVVYILYALAWVTGLTAIVAIVINYVKREEAAGTLYESHFRWQIRTFWWSLVWSILGAITLLVGVGFLIFAALFVWVVYRLVKGLLYWHDRKPLPI